VSRIVSGDLPTRALAAVHPALASYSRSIAFLRQPR